MTTDTGHVGYGEAPPTAVLGKRTMPGAEWFAGARLNYAEHMLGHVLPRLGRWEEALAAQFLERQRQRRRRTMQCC